MLLHLVSLESENPLEDYYTILKELSDYDKSLEDKEQWIIFTKKDLVSQSKIDEIIKALDNLKNRVFVVSNQSQEDIKKLQDSLVLHLRQG